MQRKELPELCQAEVAEVLPDGSGAMGEISFRLIRWLGEGGGGGWGLGGIWGSGVGGGDWGWIGGGLRGWD